MTPAARAGRSREAAPPELRRGPVEVRPVKRRHELRTFIRLPWRLYRNSPNWVPPLISERKRHLDRARNPFFEHAEAEYFIAWRGSTPVGRISAHIDDRFNEFQSNRWGSFGFFECEDDHEAAGALLDAAADWLSARTRSHRRTVRLQHQPGVRTADRGLRAPAADPRELAITRTTSRCWRATGCPRRWTS